MSLSPYKQIHLMVYGVALYATWHAPDEIFLASWLFFLSNLLICVVYLHFEGKKNGIFSTLSSVIYFVFTFIYVFKALYVNAFELNEFPMFFSIKRYITFGTIEEAYSEITLVHVFFLIFLMISHLVRARSRRSLSIPGGLLAVAVVPLLLWVLISSAVMMYFGAAVMGTEGVSLPYGLSGLLFYSRTIVLPIFLVSALAACLLENKLRMARVYFGILLILAVSEILVRASKAPFIVLLLQLTVVFMLLREAQAQFEIRLPKAQIAVIAVAILVIYPVISAYRLSVIGGDRSDMMASVHSMSGSGLLASSASAIFDRLLGYTPFVGVLEDQIVESQWEGIRSYGGVARLYTEDYLDLDSSSHLSSPSLLGASHLFLGGSYWPLMVVIFFLVYAASWYASDRFIYFRIGAKSVVIAEAVNTLMAGTIDDSLFRLALMFGSCWMMEVVLRARLQRRAQVLSQGAR